MSNKTKKSLKTTMCLDIFSPLSYYVVIYGVYDLVTKCPWRRWLNWWRIHLQWKKPWFDFWVRKISWRRIGYPFQYVRASLVTQKVKTIPAVWETWVWSLGWEDPLEECMATHSSILARRLPMDRGAWWECPWGRKESDWATKHSKGEVKTERLPGSSVSLKIRIN